MTGGDRWMAALAAGVLLAACGATGDPSAGIAALAAELQPTTRGRTWTYAVELEGRAFTATRTLLAIEQRWIAGWDLRLPTANDYLSLDGGATQVDKSLLPLRDGALHLLREGLFDASWEYSPPIPLFGGAGVRPGDSWEWRGSLLLHHGDTRFSGPSTAAGRAEAWEPVEVPAGTFVCLRTRTLHAEPPLEIVRWHAPGVGLVREHASDARGVFYTAALETCD